MLTHRFNTILGNIPDDWDVESLANVIAYHKSGDWGDEQGDKAVNVIRSTNFTDDIRLDLTDVAVRYLKESSAERLALKDRDLLLERSGGGPTQPVGRVGLLDKELPSYAFSNFVQLLRADPGEIDPDFLGWVLHELNKSGVIERLQHQTTQMRNLDYRDYLKILIPKPPSEEQKAIAHVLRSTDEAIARIRDEIKATQQLKQSLMQQLFTCGIPGKHQEFKQTKIGKIPEDWDLVQLHSITEIGAGVALNQDRRPQANAYRYLTVVNVQRGAIDLTEERYLELWETEVPSRLLQEKDILIVEGHADGRQIGRAAIVDERCSGMAFQNHLFRVRVTSDEIDPEYLLEVLNGERMQRHWNAVCNTSSGLNTINRRTLRKLLIPKPKPDEQKELIAIVHQLQDLEGSELNELDKITDLKRSLLQNLLTGKVRVNLEAIAL